jgi:hypothetical protein
MVHDIPSCQPILTTSSNSTLDFISWAAVETPNLENQRALLSIFLQNPVAPLMQSTLRNGWDDGI